MPLPPVSEPDEPQLVEVQEPVVGEDACPRDGAVVLSDLRNPTLDRLRAVRPSRDLQCRAAMEQHGDAKLTDLLQTLANCPKARSASIHDRCRAVFEGLAV